MKERAGVDGFDIVEIIYNVFCYCVMRHIYLVFSVLLTLAVACNGSVRKTGNKGNDEKERSEAPAPRLVDIEEPADRARYSSGDIINLRLSLQGNASPDSVRIFFEGTLKHTLYRDELEYGIETASARLGLIPLKIMAYKGEGRPQVITRFVTIISDIQPDLYTYRVVNTYPHDKQAYTQGLLYHEGYFFESTGGEGKSSLRKVEIETGEVLKMHRLESKFFGEGLVVFEGRLYQLTWKNNVGFVYDIESFEEIKRVHYTTQGWGLTSNGEELIMSDGTNKLYFLEPEYFTVQSSIEVYDNQNHVWQLNELEYINGEIWANIYTTERIARIDPGTGKVLAYIDLSGILSPEDDHPELAEMNGIAWDEDNERLFITGKNWPRLFEIKTVRRR
ncbi:MAG: glutaminyl-peptide cyclotransferase [Bacteroidales bacterium]|jgi:glutamine cyclotransferase|nr:glutaminyl-peptide cyclotransferase [Bacteroidales bacterium]